MDEIPRRVHFVGIGGVGMSGLAQHLHNLGYIVSGSDRLANDRTDALSKIGIVVHIGHDACNVTDAELLVRTSAVHDDNVEVVAAVSKNIPVILREQLLGVIFNSFDKRIAVCGTHGKTTVTAMIHEILQEAHVSHTALIGGVYHGNNYFFGQNLVVAEACEFNRSFYNLYPTVCVCLNAEFDHPDCYNSQADVHEAFAHFMDNTAESGTVVLPYELRNLCVLRKRLCFDKQYEVTNVTLCDGKPCFDITLTNGESHTIQLGVTGKHNVNNALAAIAVCYQLLNVEMEIIKKGLRTFDGVDRRWTEHKTELCNVVVDYAHHPTEIACSVATARSITHGKVVCVFQPHTYSRTQAFFDRFATCFTGVSVAYLPIYSAREKPIVGVNSYELTERAKELGIDAHFMPDFQSAKQWIENTVSKDDILLILGAGDVVELAGLLQ